MSERNFLYQAPVPASMDGVKARVMLQRVGRCDQTLAVLGMLREMAAESTQTALMCARSRKTVSQGPNGQVLVTEMDDPVFHAGAAAGLEDAFWAVFGAMESTEVEKESESVNP